MVEIPGTIDPVQPYRPHERPLAGKVAVITGASANMGAALARTLAHDGARIVVHYRSDNKKEPAAEVVRQIQKDGGEAVSFQADLTVPENCTKLADAAFEAFGRWDILINTAGMIVRKPLADITEEEYDGVFNTNAKTVFFMMREAARRMADDGRILSFVTTMVGALAPTYSAYAGSKAPVEHFTKALAKEVGGRGITVNCIAPGPLQTSFFYPAESDDNIAWLQSMSINGKIGRGDDILPVARLLVLPESGWTTAQTIFVNGGIISTIN
ncbi:MULTISPECIES: SDR family oxidoreductase [Mycobacteroides]|uniref:SDR family oxidoreductase n=1 Tax=Mycobacteroides TaxID=670516 RepID=UPI0007131F4C|nr:MULTISPECIES: SDR family oxidoreductase [Mycobacteroides]KRQ28165.1 short-chain dehydrogenase [Mycobacteroides sp. H072]KRQ34110.1 short-chain dehydrogenase [Mycobacteroides sp. H002]KRQ53769.1 short-chain dehydrogenase [Mycobacteroides sp. H054]KRQ66732.1 short-chain dehydrogenase [Mycobacteroides sp. H001]OHU34188.1 short-chain dehydrogenase [Mycobacteroides chelonae]